MFTRIMFFRIGVVAGVVLLVGTIVLRSSFGSSSTHSGAVTRSLVYATQEFGVDGNASFPTGPSTIWQANVDGTHPAKIGVGSHPQISPDGRRVAYADGELYVMPAGGGMSMRLTSSYRLGGAGFYWAPDSRHLLVDYQFGTYVDPIYVVNVVDAGIRDSLFGGLGGVREIFRSTAMDAAANTTGSFSPDGHSLVYSAIKGEYSGSDLYITDLKSGKTRQLTHLGDTKSPVWGPSDIAFSHGQGEIWLVSSTGTHLHQLGNEYSLGPPRAWSADGKLLVADTNDSSFSDPYSGYYPVVPFQAIDVPSGKVRRTVGGNLLALSRDGRVALINTCSMTPSEASGHIATIALAGGKADAITAGEYSCDASWNR